MDKQKILKAVFVAIEEDLRRQLAANELAAEGATHAEAKAETKWDTCGLEQSYLARGHAQQFALLVEQLEALRGFILPSFDAQTPIEVGALITAEIQNEQMHFFLLHCAGGLDLEVDGQSITVITPESPVGAALLDKRVGDTYSFRAGMTGIIQSIC